MAGEEWDLHVLQKQSRGVFNSLSLLQKQDAFGDNTHVDPKKFLSIDCLAVHGDDLINAIWNDSFFPNGSQHSMDHTFHHVEILLKELSDLLVLLTFFIELPNNLWNAFWSLLVPEVFVVVSPGHSKRLIKYYKLELPIFVEGGGYSHVKAVVNPKNRAVEEGFIAITHHLVK